MKVSISIKKTRQANALSGIKYKVPSEIMLPGEDKRQNLAKSSDQGVNVRLACVRGAIK